MHTPVRPRHVLLQASGGLLIACGIALALYLVLAGAFILLLLAIPAAVVGLVLTRKAFRAKAASADTR